MGSVRHRRYQNAPAAWAYDEIEESIIAFNDRLHRQRLQLVTLGAVLACSDHPEPAVFEQLRDNARTLYAWAQAFDDRALMSASDALQRAARGAEADPAGNSDSVVWSALVHLVNLIGTDPMPNSLR